MTRREHDVNPDIAEAVWNYLDRHCSGEKSAMKEAELAAAHGLNSRRIQRVLEFLVVKKRRPIASSCRPPYGVFVAETSAEKERYARQLERRIIATARRMRAFVKAPRVHVLTQEALFPE